MNFPRIFLLALSLLPLEGVALLASEPLNLSTAKANVARYHESGEYEKDISAVLAEAQAWIELRASGRKPGERLAVVMDLDETVLDNTPHIKQLDYGYLPEEWVRWVVQADAPVFAPAKALALRVRALGLDLIYLTGRHDPRDRAGTEENLRKRGLSDYSRLLMAPERSSFSTSAERKSAARAALEKEGFVIIANIGDQESDLRGGHSERCFKLPNPFYLTP